MANAQQDEQPQPITTTVCNTPISHHREMSTQNEHEDHPAVTCLPHGTPCKGQSPHGFTRRACQGTCMPEEDTAFAAGLFILTETTGSGRPTRLAYVARTDVRFCLCKMLHTGGAHKARHSLRLPPVPKRIQDPCRICTHHPYPSPLSRVLQPRQRGLVSFSKWQKMLTARHSTRQSDFPKKGGYPTPSLLLMGENFRPPGDRPDAQKKEASSSNSSRISRCCGTGSQEGGLLAPKKGVDRL
jgi:hypothetical protein